MTRRSKTKYPALDATKNLRSRSDLIDFDYLDKLSERELEFLNKFVSETIITDFNHHPEMKKLIRQKKQIIEDATYLSIKREIESLKKRPRKNEKRIKELKKTLKLIKDQNQEIYADKLADIEEALQELREKYLLFPDKNDHKQFYNENNSRNTCMLNRAKTMNKLDNIDDTAYEELEENKQTFYFAEDELIDLLERVHWEELEEYLESVKEYHKSKIESKN